MRSLTGIFILFVSLHSLGQQITFVDNKHFKIDSTMFSVAKIKCVKKVETPFVPGGDAKFARKSQINFKLRNSSSACITFGDSLYIQWVIELRQSEPEYYFFSDDIVKTGEQSIYTYASAKDPENEKYICVVDFVVMDGKKYFLLMDTCAKDLEKVLHLVRDLKDLIR